MNRFINKIIHDDCMNVLKQLPDKSVDLVLTDPPYGGGSCDAWKGKITSRVRGRFKKYEHDDDSHISHWDVAPAQEVFEEIFRVSKNQIIWGGNYFNLPPTRCFNVWKKLTISENFSIAMAEYAWTSFNKNAKVFEFAPQDQARFHPTQKPVALIGKQIEMYSNEGDVILDCFSGSGTTAIACHDLKRNFICVEKSKKYFDMSVKRLNKHQAQLCLC